jgi:hypothetical protein
LLPPVALASCRQMPPARRRYIVHCIMRYELEPYNRDVRDEKWQAGADRCLWRSAISRSDPIGPLIPTHPCSGRKRLPENKGASSTKATDRENRGLTGRFRFRAIGVFLLVARFARVIALGTPHHVTQRGNARQFILTTDAERLIYLDLLRLSVVQRRRSLRNGAARHIAGYATLRAILDNR